MNQVIGGKFFLPSSAGYAVLIESFAFPEKIEALLVPVELFKPLRRKGIAGKDCLALRRVSLAPIQESEQEARDGNAVHRIARRDLTDFARLDENLPNAHTLTFPIGHEHRDPVLFKQVVLLGFMAHGFLVAQGRLFCKNGGWPGIPDSNRSLSVVPSKLFAIIHGLRPSPVPGAD